jgi:hypothetical protein
MLAASIRAISKSREFVFLTAIVSVMLTFSPEMVSNAPVPKWLMHLSEKFVSRFSLKPVYELSESQCCSETRAVVAPSVRNV